MSTPNSGDIRQRLDRAVEFARAAGELTLQHFRKSDLNVERKADDSPVTVADRKAEELLRQKIGQAFPDDAVLGEELGLQEGTSGFQWVLDPIDGTKSFIHGIPLYTTLVAVLHDDQPQVGVINAPAAGEMVYAASGQGCHYTAPWHAEPVRAQVSDQTDHSKALLLTSEVMSFEEDRNPGALDVYLDLDRQVRLARTWGDAYGYLMVATGRAEIMIDPAMNLWDAAALQPVIEEAGGRFTDWKGERTVHSKEAIGTNGPLTDWVLEVIERHR